MKRSHKWIIFFVIPLVIVVTLSLWTFNQLLAKRTASVSQFSITHGESTAVIIEHLKEQGLIDSTTIALGYARLHPMTFLPGTYTIPSSYTIPQLLTIFTKEAKEEKRLTVPEGFTRQQIAELLPTVNLSGASFLKLTIHDEGKLFPDTYNVDDKTTESVLRTRMLEQYTKKTTGMVVSTNDLILASIVEREAKTDAERPIIAGIYKNRLKIGMGLEADPTVQYGKYTDLALAPLKDGKRNYWAPITKNDYSSVNSPFNTYLNKGLPPAPICNPGLKSITATLNATQTDAVYFFHTSDGRIITSKTLDEHNTNKAKYLR